MSASYQEAAALFNPTPRVVFVDAGFTLTFHDGVRLAAYAALAGVTLDAAAAERVEGALRAELREQPGVAARTHDDGGKSWLERLFRRELELAGAPGAPAALDRAAAIILREHLASNVWRRVGAGVREALARLRTAGFRLAVVSNSEGTVEQMLIEVGLRDMFETVVDSGVVGAAKPDPRIFHVALDRVGVPASDVVMVGDSPTADVTGPRAVGIRAALLDPYGLYPWVDAPRFPDLGAFATALLA